MEHCFKFNKSDIKKYKNTSKISVKFLKDNLTTTANFKIVKGKDKKKYGVITLSKYAIDMQQTDFWI